MNEKNIDSQKNCIFDFYKGVNYFPVMLRSRKCFQSKSRACEVSREICEIGLQFLGGLKECLLHADKILFESYVPWGYQVILTDYTINVYYELKSKSKDEIYKEYEKIVLYELKEQQDIISRIIIKEVIQNWRRISLMNKRKKEGIIVKNARFIQTLKNVNLILSKNIRDKNQTREMLELAIYSTAGFFDFEKNYKDGYYNVVNFNGDITYTTINYVVGKVVLDEEDCKISLVRIT